MALETGTYIDDFVITNPTGADDRSTADDHLRLIKTFIKNTFPNITGAMTISHTDLNGGYMSIPAGSITTWQQTAAPTGWTKITTHNNKSFRVVSGTAGSGGSVAFTTAFASKSVAGTNSGTALSIAQMPAHTHDVVTLGTAISNANVLAGNSAGGGATVTNAALTKGGGGTHTHTFSGTAINLAVQYVDLILASKD